MSSTCGDLAAKHIAYYHQDQTYNAVNKRRFPVRSIRGQPSRKLTAAG